MGPEDNPRDDEPIDQQEYEKWEASQMASSPQIKAEWIAGWHARDEEVAAKDRRIAELEAQSRITEDTSDGYHTFKELYDHRHALFSAVIAAYGGWKSLHHHDGSMFDGWFIAGVRTHRGDATYHIPLSLYACFPGEEVERAPEWDGHTPQQAAERIAALSFGASLQAQIDRVRALAEELNQCAGDWGVREQIAKRILTALGEPAAELERKQR